MVDAKDITYTISIKEMDEILKEHEYVKILFYKNDDGSIIEERTYGDPPNKKTIYTISINDLIEAIKEHNGAKIEFYNNGEFSIMDILGDGNALASIYNEYVYASDFYEACDGDVEKFANWLRYYWRDGFDTFEDGNRGHTIYVNWIE